MKKLKQLSAMLLFTFLALTSFNDVQAQQTMTFDACACEPRFAFSGWGWYNNAGNGIAYVDQPNVNWTATITLDQYCWDAISFQKIPFGGGSGTWKVWDNTGREHFFQIFGGGVETLNWTGIRWLKIKLEDPGTGVPNNAWDFDNLVYNIPVPVPASTPIVSVNPTSICPYDSVQLSLSGQLNDASQWYIYEGSCGGTLVDSTLGGPVWVKPGFDSKTYFVRGEGLCAPDGPCNAGAFVEVIDTIAPQMTCPGDTIIDAAPGTCGAVFSFEEPDATDNCGDPGVYQLSGLDSDSIFPVGDNILTFRAWDISNNEFDCSYTVTVNDPEDPVAACMDITTQLDALGEATINASGLDGGSSDNCQPLNFNASQEIFDCNHIGPNVVTLTVTDPSGNDATCQATVTVEDPLNSCCVFQEIPIDEGWNIISSYILPDALDFLDILAPIESDIIIAKDEDGQVAIPSGPLNQIGDWAVTEGYQIRASTSTGLILGCTLVDPALTPIPLTNGWNIMSYLRTDPMDAAAALNSITDDITIVKDNDGRVYVPSIPFNNIGNLLPGQGYQIKVNTNTDLTYPANGGRVASSVPYTEPGQSERLIYRGNTGNNATILIPEGSIPDLMSGDEIGVFNHRGELCGAAVYQGGTMAIAVWGNDASAGDERHMAVGEPFGFKVSSARDGQLRELLVSYKSGAAAYAVNGISVISEGKFGRADQVLGESRLSVYPNPASDAVQFTLELSKSSAVYLTVYDLTGKQVIAPRNERADAGQTNLAIDIRHLPSGEYFYRIATEEQLFNGSFMKMQ